MSKKYLVVAGLIIAATFSTFAQKIPEPTLTPTPLTDAQRALVREGVKLHNQGKLDEAIRKYEEASKDNPASDTIAYELGSLFKTKKDYAKCIEMAKKAAQYKSNVLPKAYVLLGNCYDEKDEPQKALEVYKHALKQFPNEGGIYFNQAITLNRLEKLDEAKVAAKRSAMLNPNHASTQLLLASIFYQGRYKVPALLAALRFLVLEPATIRSQVALKIVGDVLEGGVSKGADNKTKVAIDPNAKDDEGDFAALDLVLAGLKAGVVNDNGAKKSDAQRSIEQIEMIVTMLADEKDEKNKFAFKYYIPYFAAMKSQKLTEPFWYIISASNKKAENDKWLLENQKRVDEFMNWSANYKWQPANER